MTVVVGVKGENGVLLAADQQSSYWNSNRMDRDPKTIQLSDILAVAACGSGRLGNVLRYEVMEHLEEPPLGMDEHYWTVREFIPHLRNVLWNAGQLLDIFGLELMDDSSFLFAVRGRLFGIDADLQVTEHVQPFDALGSGEQVAMGAMEAFNENKSTDPFPDSMLEEIAVAGVEAAIKFTNFVGGEITFAHTFRFTEEEKEIAREILKK